MSVRRLAQLLVTLSVVLPASCSGGRFGGEKESALVAATAAHDVARVQSLLEAGANPNLMVPYDALNESPWWIALDQLRPRTAAADVAIIKAMLKAGADPTAAWGEATSRGITRRHSNPPIQMVMLNPDVNAVRALLDTGRTSGAEGTALLMAIEQGEAEIAHLLVESGVDVNSTHGGPHTPLVAAIERRDKKMIAYLEEHGALERPPSLR